MMERQKLIPAQRNDAETLGNSGLTDGALSVERVWFCFVLVCVTMFSCTRPFLWI